MKLLQPALATRQSQKNEQEEIKTRRFFNYQAAFQNLGSRYFSLSTEQLTPALSVPEGMSRKGVKEFLLRREENRGGRSSLS